MTLNSPSGGTRSIDGKSKGMWTPAGRCRGRSGSARSRELLAVLAVAGAPPEALSLA